MLHAQSYRGLLRIYHDVICQIPVAYYVRTKPPSYRYTARSKSKPNYDFDDPAVYKLTERLEDEELLDNQPPRETHSQKSTVFKTIERKFFRPPQEVNLLTWDAKEQIRYLHQEFPDEWTIEKLAQSFPISEDGIRRLLRSRFQPRTADEVIRHDRRVQKAWKALKDVRKGHLTSGPIVSRYELLKENNKLHLLSNAAGNKYLPQSDWQQKLLQGRSSRDREPGVYESIITDYMKLKAAKDKIVSSLSKKEQQMLSDNSLSNEVYLEIMMRNVAKEPADTNTDNYAIRDDKNPKHQLSNEARRAETRRGITLLSADSHNDDTDTDKSSGVSLMLDAASKKEYVSVDDQISVGLRGTKKLSSGHRENEDEVENFTDMSEDEIINLQKENIASLPSTEKEFTSTNKLEEDIYFESPVGSDVVEPYMYNPEKGYRYPFGRSKDLPQEKIDVSKIKKASKNETTLIKDGKNVYDEDGEFLYRIP